MGKECYTVVQMIVKDEGCSYFAAKATFDARLGPHRPDPPPHKHTRTNKRLMTSAQPTQPSFQFPSRRMHKFSYHTNAQK